LSVLSVRNWDMREKFFIIIWGLKNMTTRTRAAGEGTIYQNTKRDRWEGQFSYVDPETGKTKRKMITGKGQTEVSKKGKAFLKSIEDGLLPDADKLTVWSWIERWLADYIKPNVRVRSYEKYESTLKCYIKPKLGNVIITKLKSPDIQSVLNELLTTGGRKGTGISTSTVRMTRRYLTMAFDKAVKVGVLAKNVVKETDQPRLIKEEIHPLTAEQADQLLVVAKEGEYIYYGVKQKQKPGNDSKYLLEVARIAVMVALNTGMRLGEVFGLKWEDIEFKGCAINVRRSLAATSTQGVIFEEPKTKGSRRRIPVTEKLIKALERYKKEQEWLVNLLGDKYSNEGTLVFANSSGKPMNPAHFTSRYFKRMVKQTGLDDSFTFHDLRHTHATLLLKQGINIKVISERLGHSTITMTLDTYSHVMPDMQETAVKALEMMDIG